MKRRAFALGLSALAAATSLTGLGHDVIGIDRRPFLEAPAGVEMHEVDIAPVASAESGIDVAITRRDGGLRFLVTDAATGDPVTDRDEHGRLPPVYRQVR